VGNSLEVIQSNVNSYMRSVIRRIEFLSLEVAPEKMGVVLFWGRKRVDAKAFSVRIKDIAVQPRPCMKYLGVVLDSKLNPSPVNYNLYGTVRNLGRKCPVVVLT